MTETEATAHTVARCQCENGVGRCSDGLQFLRNEELSAAESAQPSVLILTPVKNAVHHLDRYFSNLRSMSYPKHRTSIGLLDSDSDDTPAKELLATYNNLVSEGSLPRILWDDEADSSNGSDSVQLKLRGKASGTGELNDDEPATGRHEAPAGLSAPRKRFRRSATLLRLLIELPALREEYRAVTIVQHNFGLHLSRAERHSQAAQLARRNILARSRNYLLFTALGDEDWTLWVDSDLEGYGDDIVHQLLSSGKQIVVPNCVMAPGGRSYDLNSWRVRSLPNNASVEEVVRYHDKAHARMSEEGRGNELQLEGYGPSGSHVYLDKLRKEGEVVRLDGVGGAMLMVDADLHRQGLIFPPYVHRHRIETEGLSMMALDMGVLSWGMPSVEILHK